jgi:hypothetical protein
MERVWVVLTILGCLGLYTNDPQLCSVNYGVNMTYFMTSSRISTTRVSNNAIIAPDWYYTRATSNGVNGSIIIHLGCHWIERELPSHIAVTRVPVLPLLVIYSSLLYNNHLNKPSPPIHHHLTSCILKRKHVGRSHHDPLPRRGDAFICWPRRCCPKLPELQGPLCRQGERSP